MVRNGRDKHSAYYSPVGEWEVKRRYIAGVALDRYTAKTAAQLDEIRRLMRERRILEMLSKGYQPRE